MGCRMSWAELQGSSHNVKIIIFLWKVDDAWARTYLFGSLWVHTSSTSNKLTVYDYLLTWKFQTPYS